MNQERLMKVLVGPHTSEKSTRVSEKHNQVVFKVLPNSTKDEIKQAVEFLLKVKVNAVRTVNVKGKSRRTGQVNGRRNDWKKAYVSLAEGNDISFVGAE